MIAIAVDDEILMLGALAAAIEASPDITKVTKFYQVAQDVEQHFLLTNLHKVMKIEKIPQLLLNLKLLTKKTLTF